MKNAEKKTKHRGSFNALDVAVFLTVLALVVTAVLRAGLIDRLTFSSKSCTVLLVCENVDSRISAPASSEYLYTENGDSFGKVSAVSLTPSEIDVTDADGIERTLDLPSDYIRNLEISVECKLGIKDGRYINFAGDIIVPGAEFTLHTATTTFICTVSSVTD